MRQMSLSEMITYSTLKIECKDAYGNSSTGSGFIMNLHSDELIVPVIITNNHVVDGCIETSFEFCKADSDGNPIDTDPYRITVENGNAWRSHPDRSIDLCFLPLKSVIDEITNLGGHVFYIPLDSEIIADDAFLSTLCAVEDVVMIGYPQGIVDSYNHKPVIRRGITATHPRNNYMGRPDILLDIATYFGSSGSPVFILNEGSYFVGNTLQVGSRIKLLGILYCGPTFKATGEIVFSNVPIKPVPIIDVPCNLGVAIKAKEIRGIEEYIKKELNERRH